MTTTTLSAAPPTLGGFLRERRARMRPETGGDRRRRTPGLRREEVATRAGLSVTWYTWLEQGRGGPPSAEALERLARTLELDGDNRELLFLLAQQRPPPVRTLPAPTPSPTLQRVLDAMSATPAIVKTPTWDIVAWNAAATALLADYGALPTRERNVLRRLFTDDERPSALPDWEANARFALAVFRIDVARAGGSAEAEALVAELRETSPAFGAMWSETNARSHGVGVKRMTHPKAGLLTFDVSAFPVDGAEGLTMIVFSPATDDDAERASAVVDQSRHAGVTAAGG